MILTLSAVLPNNPAMPARDDLNIYETLAITVSLTAFSLIAWFFFMYVRMETVFVLSLLVCLVAYITACLVFMRWKDFRTIPLVILFFLMSAQQTLPYMGLVGMDHYFIFRAFGQVHNYLTPWMALVSMVLMWRLFEDYHKARLKQLKVWRSENRLHSLFQNRSHGICILDVQENEIETNQVLRDLMQIDEKSAAAFSLVCATHPDFRSDLQGRLDNLLLGRESGFQMQIQVLPSDGLPKWIEISAQTVHTETGEVDSVICILKDVHRQKQIQTALRESRQSLSNFLKNMPGMAYRLEVRTDWKLSYISDGVREISGYLAAELLKSERCIVPDLVHPDDGARAWQELLTAIELEKSYELEYRILTADNEERWVLDKGAPVFNEDSHIIALEGLVTDISVMKRAEVENLRLGKQMLENQRLESLAVLAGGIAHDFNNLLAAIIGHTDICMVELPQDAPNQADLRQIRTAAERSAELTRQLLAYSGMGTVIVEEVNFSRLVRSEIHELRETLPAHVHLSLNLSDGLPLVEADKNQMQQLLRNLFSNSIEAISEKGGEIRITTDLQSVKAGEIRSPNSSDNLPAGQYLVIEVADNGCGMEEKTLKRIFDPFFSTKFLGRGLGLAAVQGIIRAHHGSLTIESKPEMGTSVKVFLPALELFAPENYPGYAIAHAAKARAKVLVIDGDAQLRELAKILLERSGFMVDTAARGDLGVRMYNETESKYDLVLLDMAVGRCSAENVIANIQTADPEARIILISGKHSIEQMKEFCRRGNRDYLLKPYEFQDLVNKIVSMTNVEEPMILN